MASQQQVGDFYMDDVVILSSTGTSYNIQSQIIEINIYESIRTNTMSGNIVIEDGTGMIEKAPIIGQERIMFSVSSSKDHDKIDFTVYHGMVNEIIKRTSASLTTQTYVLLFTTQEDFRNIRSKVSRSFTGTPNEIIQNIFKDENYLNCKKGLVCETTKGNKKYVMPNLRPFDCINLIREGALSDTDIGGYLFFENHRGFHFRTFLSLLEDKSKVPYPPKRIFVHGPPATANEKSQQMSIIQYEIVRNGATFQELKKGMFGSKLTKYDMYNKNFGEYHFDYLNSFDSYGHSMSNKNQFGPMVSDAPMDETKKKISEFHDARCFLTSSGSNNLFTDGLIDNESEKWVQQNFSKESESYYFINNITILGDSSLAAGDVIELRIPTSKISKKSIPTEDQMDSFLSGRHVIESIRHKITPRSQDYVCFLSCIKDSVYPRLSSTEQSFEWPPEQSTGNIENLDTGSMMPATPSVKSLPSPSSNSITLRL